MVLFLSIELSRPCLFECCQQWLIMSMNRIWDDLRFVPFLAHVTHAVHCLLFQTHVKGGCFGHCSPASPLTKTKPQEPLRHQKGSRGLFFGEEVQVSRAQNKCPLLSTCPCPRTEQFVAGNHNHDQFKSRNCCVRPFFYPNSGVSQHCRRFWAEFIESEAPCRYHILSQ